MNGVARGKLGKLLLTRKVSSVSKQQNVPNSSDGGANSLSPNERIPEATKQGATAEDHPMHEPELSESDSDTSSVGDHLVDPSTINLDETFFTQSLQGELSGPDMKDFYISKDDDEVSELSESEDVNAMTVEEEDQMNQILTQVSDYDRMIKEVNVCNQSLERRRKEMETFQQTQMDVPFRLTQPGEVQGIPCAEDDLDWEHVAEQNAQTEQVNNFEIIVSSSMQKTKRVLDVNEKLKRLEQEFKRKMFLNTHKTHLLLLLAYGIRINKTVNRGIIQCASELYELIGSSEIAMGERVSRDFIQSVTSHYKTVMKLTKNAPRNINQRDAFECQLAAREVTSRKMLNVILLTLLRFLSVRARLVMNLDVVPKQPPTVKSVPKEKRSSAGPENINAMPRYGNVPLTTTEILKRKPEIQKLFQLSQLDGADEEIISIKKPRIEPTIPKPRLGKLLSSSSVSKARTETTTRSAENITNEGQKALKLTSSKYFPKKHPKTQMISERENMKTCTGMPNFAKLRKQHLGTAGKDDRTAEAIPQTSSKSSKYFRKKPSTQQTTDTCDRETTSKEVSKLVKLRHQSTATANESVKKTEQKCRIPELDTWIECYLEKERRWTVVEAGLGSTDCLDPVIDRILSPPLYAIAWEADGTIVDVSPRYRWRNEQLALKNRVEAKWLQKTLAPYRPRVLDEAHLQEQFEFRQLKLRAPKPTTIAQCKNHPSYCLHRHLQKFQAIYPPDAPPLGFVQGEPLYARECVHTLHSREVWLRHAKVIRHFEQAYKIVRTKLKRQPADLELFGYWQTEEYIPPEPVNGIVPRNAYGNIEIFKECMLPKGTVHLKHYGLSYICRKLGIDYAVAVVGFGVHAGGNHPIFDGIVICEEHRDRLLEAWQRHQDEAAQKKIEKKQTAVLKNWVKLVKGLLVRRRLKHKYNFEGM
ncbi:DNA repair protein complementing XP-C cells homolog [Anopheles moucheti]|uniref:DNA repair protein complementing XP-C cells homolog n=1 Tax=Anopheles moucheti TaxID=186751 RepID=UPI0022F0BDB1|nr:DNA repair protein complementing XP-C cells homolog [Anopheles moucheti]